MLFYFTSTPEEPLWIAGAFVCWSAYVGLNICLPNLVLKISAPGEAPRNAAIYFAATSIAYAGATLLGGELFRLWQFDRFTVGGYSLDSFHFLFYVGWVTRLLGAFVALAIIEPGAWTLPELLGWDRRSSEIHREAAIHPLDR